MQHQPTELTLKKSARLLRVAFDDGQTFDLPLEYLRVYSPSAEVRGHGPGQEVLQVGKKHVVVTRIEPVGSYAVRLVFDDGHNSGLFSWDVLYDLGINHEQNWQHYLLRLDEAGATREPR
ncbi:MAG: gamma-butyrobetaine hydroxylase-like domain-containing protein [Gammaproteobacteria bacterium]